VNISFKKLKTHFRIFRISHFCFLFICLKNINTSTKLTSVIDRWTIGRNFKLFVLLFHSLSLSLYLIIIINSEISFLLFFLRYFVCLFFNSSLRRLFITIRSQFFSLIFFLIQYRSHHHLNIIKQNYIVLFLFFIKLLTHSFNKIKIERKRKENFIFNSN
jgi:hypothetical protein